MLKDLISLSLGSGAGYLAVLLLSPALTRLYEPADFGIYGVFAAIYAVATILVPLGYDQGIVGAPRRAEAMRFAATTHQFAVVLSVALLAIALPLTPFMPEALHLTYPMVTLALLTGWLSVVGAVAINSAIRFGDTRRASASTFVNLAGRSGLQLAFGIWWGNVYGLIAGEMLGRLAAILVAETGIARKSFRRIARSPALSWAYARRHSDYARYLMPASALDVLLVWSPAPLITFAYGPAAGGMLVLIQRLASAPLTIVNQSLGQIFHLHAARAMASPHRGIVRRWIGLLAGLSLLGSVLLWVALLEWGRPFFGFIFGANWAEAADIALIWVPLIYVQFVSLLTNRLIIIMDMMRIKLIASICNIALMFTTVPIASIAGLDFQTAMIVLVGLLTLSYAIVIVVVLSKIGSARAAVGAAVVEPPQVP